MNIKTVNLEFASGGAVDGVQFIGCVDKPIDIDDTVWDFMSLMKSHGLFEDNTVKIYVDDSGNIRVVDQTCILTYKDRKYELSANIQAAPTVNAAMYSYANKLFPRLTITPPFFRHPEFGDLYMGKIATDKYHEYLGVSRLASQLTENQWITA